MKFCASYQVQWVQTALCFEGEQVNGLPGEVQETDKRKRRIINNLLKINALRILPANRLEKLSGKSKNIYSIRINDQWGIIFKWSRGNAANVEIIDYH